MHPGRSLTIPLGAAGVIAVWLVAIAVTVCAIFLSEDGPLGPFSLRAVGGILMNVGVLSGFAIVLKSHRMKVKRFLDENRAAILEGVGLQVMMYNAHDDEVGIRTKVRRLPTTRPGL